MDLVHFRIFRTYTTCGPNDPKDARYTRKLNQGLSWQKQHSTGRKFSYKQIGPKFKKET
jgi:hypothetical protein